MWRRRQDRSFYENWNLAKYSNNVPLGHNNRLLDLQAIKDLNHISAGSGIIDCGPE